ncbi:serine hydrolase domain-containing protein [Sphingosinicella microcystinivorans]|uniref:serine hydrolase domain-containing protein n=1 Tax=Sphingosinicella microcystinivorans TaxID=335406 RepID=UPI0022F3F14F|nr:serine hydrolase domain-containing protein [Sphingosinicella microcystinivorans]WBX84118.1 serine hydrolase [Sphingosinicella microcystinivorans]
MLDGDARYAARLQAILDTTVRHLGNEAALAGIQWSNGERLVLAAGTHKAGLSLRRPEDAVIMIASQTKTLVAACILKLFRQRGLSLDARACEFVELGPIDAPVTIRQLLTCTSGLGEYDDLMFTPDYRGDVTLSPEELIKLTVLRGPSGPPGDHFEYANINFVILALVVEGISGLAFEEAARQLILKPLGLVMWFAAREELPAAQMVSGYWQSRDREPVHIAELDHSAAFATGDAACSVSTAIDFWAGLADPTNPSGISLADLAAESVQAPLRVRKPASLGVQYGYGLEFRSWAGDPVVGHPGSIHGARSGSWVDLEKGIVTTVYVTSQAQSTEDPRIAALRYPGPALYTAMLQTAYILDDLHRRGAA